MKVLGSTSKPMDLESFIAIATKPPMKGIGSMTSSKGKGRRLGRMVLPMRVSIRMARSTVEGCLSGAMETCTLGISRTTKWMAMVCTIGKVVKCMMVSGKRIAWMERE